MAILRPEAIDDAPARGPERSGGRRKAAFLPREECAEPGSPGDLLLGVVPQGKKVAGRRCDIGDRGEAVLRPAQATRGRVGRAPGQPGRRAGDRLRPPKRDTQARPTAPSQRRPQHTADMAATRLPVSVHSLPVGRPGREPPERGCTTLDEAHPLPSASNPASSLVRASAPPFWPAADDTDVRPRPAPPGAGVRSCFLASGIEPVRDETAKPVRAEPTSPARRATPKPDPFSIFGCVRYRDLIWPIVAALCLSNPRGRASEASCRSGKANAGTSPGAAHSVVNRSFTAFDAGGGILRPTRLSRSSRAPLSH